MEPFEGEGGKRWAEMFPDICLSWAHRSVAGLPKPKSAHEMRLNFTQVQACVREMVCTVRTWHSIFSIFSSNHCTNSESKDIVRKNQAFQWCAQVRKVWGGCKVMPWGTHLATFAWGKVTQWWGRPIVRMERRLDKFCAPYSELQQPCT